jgi:AdoMet-dependent heme synthase
MRFKINSFFSILSKIPNEIMIEVTDRCNLKCEFCFNKLYILQSGKGDELSTLNIKEIIDKIKKAKVPILRFTGGEPLLRDDIFELMNYAYQKGLKVWLNTNATLIDRPIAQKISRYVENVLVSLNSYSSTSELSLTGNNVFKSKLKGILLLKESRIKHLRCGTVATKFNIINLEKIHNFIKRVGVDNWELFRVIPSNKEKLPMDNSDISLLVEKLIEINEKENKNYKIANALPFCAYDPERVRKVAIGGIADDGHSRLVIDSKGCARPMYYINENIGNILRDDVSSIWNNNFMKKMRSLDYAPMVCKKCKYISICKGGSRITAKIIQGKYDAIDYLAQPYRIYSKA